MISPYTFRAFTETVKSATVAPTAAAHPLVELVKRIKPRDAALVAGGAASLYGGQRLLGDIRMGEQMRRGGGGYY